CCVCCGVGLGVPRGAARPQPLTPLPLAAFVLPFGTRYVFLRSEPSVGNKAAASAPIFLMFGIWIEARVSSPEPTRGWLITARYVPSRPIFAAASARSGSSLRGTLVVTVLPTARRRPIVSLTKPPLTTRSRMPERTSCWRGARGQALSPAALRTLA